MWIVVLLNNIDFSFVSFWENKNNDFYKKNFLNYCLCKVIFVFKLD